MPGETELHKLLKREACRWLFRVGYSAIAAEVRLSPLGIIDAVGTGVVELESTSRRRRLASQVCFIECKATRSDFLRDLSNDGQLHLAMMERKANARVKKIGKRSWMDLKQAVGLGKFAACLLQPMANLHYIMAPAGVVKKTEVPERWGLLSWGAGGASVVVKAPWQECTRCAYVDGAIARTLTGDIYRADTRALMSVNREMLTQQQLLAERIRAVKAVMVESEEFTTTDTTSETE